PVFPGDPSSSAGAKWSSAVRNQVASPPLTELVELSVNDGALGNIVRVRRSLVGVHG
ncbi:hypothetical protein XENOCAPTIV_016766, partial [Xenoophorus captivus]